MISRFTSYNLRWTIYKAYTTNVSLLSSSSLMESDSKGGIENDSFVILILLFISSSWVCRVDSFNVSSAFSLSHSSFSSSCSRVPLRFHPTFLLDEYTHFWSSLVHWHVYHRMVQVHQPNERNHIAGSVQNIKIKKWR